MRTLALIRLLPIAILLLAAMMLSGAQRTRAVEPPQQPSTLSAALFNTCAVTQTRAVECWGSNAEGALGVGASLQQYGLSTRPLPVMRLKHGVVAVATGSQAGEASHSCALLSEGRVQCWGANAQGQLGDTTTTPRSAPANVCADAACTGPLTSITAISAGGLGSGSNTAHACALTSGGAVKCWGANGNGQLGDGTTIQRSYPVQVQGLTSGVIAIAGGANHSCALLATGAVKCWGANGDGQLGDGSTIGKTAPVSVSGLSSVAAIDAHIANHTCAVLTNGQVRCWGDNAQGQLGDGTTADRSTPITVCNSGSGCTALSGVASVSLGIGHTCAITTSGALTCWGDNAQGQLGDGTTTDRTKAVSVALLNGSTSTDVTAVALGKRHSCAKLATARVLCWGDASGLGLLGNGKSSGISAIPVAALVLNPSISGGYANSCAVTNAGAAVCWGTDFGDSTLGNGFIQVPRPVHVIGLSSGVAAVSVGNAGPGAHYACAVIAGGQVKCWGDNTSGQLGDGTTTDRTTPVSVTGLNDAIAVAAGGTVGSAHSCAVTAGGAAKCWGANIEGQLGDGTPTQRLTPVTVSGLSSGVVAIAAGRGHTCALTAEGGVKCWGSNSSGQLGNGTITNSTTPVDAIVPTATARAIAITAGQDHSCAVLSTGAAKCWGKNEHGILGNNSETDSWTPVAVCGDGGNPCVPLSGVVDIEGGFEHTCALVENTSGPYRVKCWGEGDFGTLGNNTGYTNGQGVESLIPVDVCAGGGQGCSAVLTGATTLTAGFYHTCVTIAAGGAKCWGSRGWGAVGDNQIVGGFPPSAADARTPVSVDDGDGCSDVQENGVNQSAGGLRDPLDFWDFYDVWTQSGGQWVRDKVVSQADSDAISARFGATGDPTGNPLVLPTNSSGYHSAYDRSSAPPGADPWDLGPPNGTIDLFIDIFGASYQIGHSCG